MRTSGPRRSMVQALLWSGYGALSLAFAAAYTPLSSGLVLIMVLVSLALWAASEGLRTMCLRGGWLEKPPGALLTRMLLWPPLFALAVQCFVFVSVSTVLRLHLVTLVADPRQGWGTFFGYVMNTSIMLWLWLGAWGSVQYLQRWRDVEVSKWKAEAAKNALELEVLRAQVNPHFIFNALNNLRALINEDPARAREMVTRLSNTLRHTLYHSSRERVPLGEELAIVRDYLALEQLHYEERLRVRWSLAPGIEAAEVPPMVLQLLVENAIKHGIARTAGGGELDIEIGRDGERLRIAVSNPGRWAPAERDATQREGGIGMTQLRERLRRAGGPGAGCEVQEAGGRVQVTVHLEAAEMKAAA